MAKCIEMGIDYDPYLSDLDLQAKHKNPDESPEVLVPFEVALGVTCCLCGGFLYMVPVPLCQNVGIVVFQYGIGTIVNELYINPTIDDIKKTTKQLKMIDCISDLHGYYPKLEGLKIWGSPWTRQFPG